MTAFSKVFYFKQLPTIMAQIKLHSKTHFYLGIYLNINLLLHSFSTMHITFSPIDTRFSVNDDLNLIKMNNQIEFDGAGHLDDLCYIFQ